MKLSTPLKLLFGVEVKTPGGGGYGDPLARDPALVARDVRRGTYDATQAAALWGVVLRDGALDEAATEALRRSRSA